MSGGLGTLGGRSHLPPSRSARDIGMINRRHRLQLWSIKCAHRESNRRLIVYRPDRAAALATECATRVARRAPCGGASTRPRPNHPLRRILDPGERERARMSSAGSTRACVRLVRRPLDTKANVPAQTSTLEMLRFGLGFHATTFQTLWTR